MDDEEFTIHVFPKPDHYPEKREFFVEIEGVIKKTYPIKAESSAKASQMAKSEQPHIRSYVQSHLRAVWKRYFYVLYCFRCSINKNSQAKSSA